MFTQTNKAGGSSSIPESTPVDQTQETGTNAAMIIYETPTVSPTDVDILDASVRGEDDEEDHMDIEVPYLLTMEEMEIREKAQEEEIKRKLEVEEARLEEMEQAKLEEAIPMEESRKAEVAAKLAEDIRLQEEIQKQNEEEAKLADELRLKAEADKLAEEQRLKDEAAKDKNEEPKDKPESQRGDDKDISTHIESSQSSPPASESTHDEPIKKPTSTKASAASKLIKKAVRRVHEKKKSKLEDQVESLASQVAELT
jgi:membrane protein involved in colicin uptake